MEQLKFQFREIIKTFECAACENIIEWEKSTKSMKCKCGIIFILGKDNLIHARVENNMRYIPQIAVKYNEKNKCYEVYRSAKEKIDVYIEK